MIYKGLIQDNDADIRQKKECYKLIYERNTKIMFTVQPSGPDRTDLRESESARAS